MFELVSFAPGPVTCFETPGVLNSQGQAVQNAATCQDLTAEQL